MATVIDAATVLATNKVLILPNLDGGNPTCTGVVEQVANTLTGDGGFVANLILDIFGPPGGGNPPSPAPIIGKSHAHVVYKLEGAQDVKIDDVDYYLIDGNDVLGILPESYDDRLF